MVYKIINKDGNNERKSSLKDNGMPGRRIDEALIKGIKTKGIIWDLQTEPSFRESKILITML